MKSLFCHKLSVLGIIAAQPLALKIADLGGGQMWSPVNGCALKPALACLAFGLRKC